MPPSSTPTSTYGMAAVYEPIKMAQRMPLGEVLRLTLLGSHERMTAQTALRIGLLSEVLPSDELQEAADRLAAIIASQPPEAVAGLPAGHLGRQRHGPARRSGDGSVHPDPPEPGPEALAEGQAAFRQAASASSPGALRPDPEFTAALGWLLG